MFTKKIFHVTNFCRIVKWRHQIISSLFWFFLWQFQCDTGNFSISNDKKRRGSSLDFLTNKIELFFLNRIVRYKRCFWQVIRKYQKKKKPETRFFYQFSKENFIPQRLKKKKIFNLRKDKIGFRKNNSGRKLLFKERTLWREKLFQVLKDKKFKYIFFYYYSKMTFNIFQGC